MNSVRRPCRCPAGPSWRASAVLAVAAASAAWRPDPPFPIGWRLPPGWNKHPLRTLGHVAGPVDKVPARIRAHTVVTTGTHDWQISLIAAGAALLAVALAILVHGLWAARRDPVADTTGAMAAATAIPAAAHISLPPPGRHPLDTGIPRWPSAGDAPALAVAPARDPAPSTHADQRSGAETRPRP
jgi:hypothetical protein